MAVTLFTLFVVLLCTFTCGEIIVLTKDNFAEETAKHELLLVAFYNPEGRSWKDYLKKHYDEVEVELAINDPPVSVAKIDCKEFNDTCQRLSVKKKYPVMKIFRNGEFSSTYDGLKYKGRMIEHMKKQTGPSATELTSLDSAEKLINGPNHTIFGFFAERTNLFNEFVKAAHMLRHLFKFVYSSEAAVLEKYSYQADVVIFRPPHLHNKFEEPQICYSGNEDADELVPWIRRNFTGLVGHYVETKEDLFKNIQPLVIGYFPIDYKLNVKGTNYYRNRMLKVASEFADKNLSFAMCDKNEFSSTVNLEFGLKPENFTVTVGIALGRRRDERPEAKYLMTSEFSVDNLRTFAQSFLDGTLQPFVKKHPVPEVNNGSVKVVVVDNFDEIVNDPTKDVLLDFYIPTCGGCVQLEPVLVEVAEKLQDDPNIVIAKFDSSANDAPQNFFVQGFPTIYWLRMGDKDNHISYREENNVAKIIDFIKTHATHQPVIKGEKKMKKKAKDKKEEL